MCGRFVTIIPADELRKIFDLIENPPAEPRYNVAPSQKVGVVRCCEPSNHNQFDVMKWGFTPSWSKELLINAKSETVAEKQTFKQAIKYRRCIIPVSGFFEWSHKGSEKHPHFIHLADKQPMGLAGIWESHKNPEGIETEYFAILTTSANKLVKTLHDRMPVILQPDTYNFWLSHNMHDAHSLEPLYTPFPDDQMSYYEVPTLVNNARFDSPSCIVQV